MDKTGNRPMDKTGNSPYTMVCAGGMFIMGRLEGGNKLLKPRVFTIEDDGKKMRLQPLPSLPPFVNVRPEFHYPIPYREEQLVSLYERVTSKAVEDKAKEVPKESPTPGGKVIMEP